MDRAKEKEVNPPLALIEWVDKVWGHEGRIADLERRIDGCALATVVFRELADLDKRVGLLECEPAVTDLSEDTKGCERCEASRSVGEVLEELVAAVGAHQVRECLKAVARESEAEPKDEQQAQLVEPFGAVRRALRMARGIEKLGSGEVANMGDGYRITNRGHTLQKFRLEKGGILKAKSQFPAGVILAWVLETGRLP